MSIAKGIHATAGIGLSTSSGDQPGSTHKQSETHCKESSETEPGKYAFNTAATDKNKSVRVFIHW